MNMFTPITEFIKSHRWQLAVLLISGLLIAGIAWGWTQFDQSVQKGQLADVVDRAEAATEEGNYHTAFELWQTAQALDSDNYYYVLKQADVAFLNGDYRIANLIYQQTGAGDIAEIKYYAALQALGDLNYTEALIRAESANQLLGESNERPLSRERAVNLIEQIKSIEAIPNDPQKRAATGKRLIEENAFELAHPVLTKLVEDESDYRDAHYLLGINYLQQGQTEPARESLNRALDIDPSYQPAREILEQIEK